jgi:hypothetical protein
VGEDLAEVVAAGAEDGEDGVAGGALERAAGEAAVGLHVADLGLDGAAAAQEPGQRGREARAVLDEEEPTMGRSSTATKPQRRQRWTTIAPPAAGLPRRFRGRILHRHSHHRHDGAKGGQMAASASTAVPLAE